MSLVVRLTSLLLLGLPLALLQTGCPSNMCFLKVDGKCKWSSCPDGAEFVDARQTCACRADRISLNGSCLTQAAANAYCGRGSRFESGGCVPIRCVPGLELDQDTGTCIPPQQVAANMGVAVGQNQKLGCPPGEQLVVEGGGAACVPLQQLCARDETWDGRGCRKLAQCPPGASFDPALNGCVQFASGSGQREYQVDLVTWLRTSYGADGATGSSGFCGAFSKHPLAFGVGPGGVLRVRIVVQVSSPDQQVAHATVSTLGQVEPTGQPVTSRAGSQIYQAAQDVLQTLVAGGGKANERSATTTVRCTVVNSSRPAAVSVTGGA